MVLLDGGFATVRPGTEPERPDWAAGPGAPPVPRHDDTQAPRRMELARLALLREEIEHFASWVGGAAARTRDVAVVPAAPHAQDSSTDLPTNRQAAVHHPGSTPSLPSPPTIQLLEVTDQYQVRTRPTPAPQIPTGTQVAPEQIGH